MKEEDEYNSKEPTVTRKVATRTNSAGRFLGVHVYQLSVTAPYQKSCEAKYKDDLESKSTD